MAKNNGYRLRLNRRKVLQSIASSSTLVGGVAVGSGVVAADSCGIPDLDYDYSEKDHEWKESDSVNDTNTPSGMTTEYGIETQTAVFGNSIYFDGHWLHKIYEGSHIVTKNKSAYDSEFQLAENLYSHKVVIENNWTGTGDLLATEENDSHMVGAAPDPNGSTDYGAYGDFAYTALKAALAMESAKFSVAVTAINLAGALIDTGKTDSGNTQEYSWNYSSADPCEAAHKAAAYIEMESGYEKASVHIYEYSVADMGNINNSHTFSITIDPTPNIQSLSPNQTASSEKSGSKWKKMSESERTSYLESSDNIVKIQDISEYPGFEGNGPAYVARNPKVEITSKDTAPEKYRPEK